MHLVIQKITHGPQALTAADGLQELFQYGSTPISVHHLGVELQPVERFGGMLHRRHGAGRGAGQHLPGACGPGFHLVAVAHPDGGVFLPHRVEQSAAGHNLHGCPPKFAVVRPLHLGAQRLAQGLHPVADAQDRDAQVQNGRIEFGSPGIVNTGGTATEDDPLGSQFSDAGGCQVVADQAAKHPVLPHAPGDELGVLRAEIKD